VFKEGHAGRETGHASETSFEKRPVTDPYHTYWSVYNRANAYQFEYQLQKEKYNSGLPGLWVQDAACQSGVMAVYDRTREHLGTTDTGIARTRRLLLDTLRRLTTENQSPASVTDPDQFLWRAISIIIPAAGDWMGEGAEFMKARLGEGFGYKP
jgi:hypothetical protein